MAEIGEKKTGKRWVIKSVGKSQIKISRKKSEKVVKKSH